MHFKGRYFQTVKKISFSFSGVEIKRHIVPRGIYSRVNMVNSVFSLCAHLFCFDDEAFRAGPLLFGKNSVRGEIHRVLIIKSKYLILNKMKLSATILALAAATASAAVPSLTPDNYDAMTDGKTVFIKFFAPW